MTEFAKALHRGDPPPYTREQMAMTVLPQQDSTLTLPVKRLVKRPALFVDASATVAQAAQAMQNARVGSVLVATEPPGILTDRDLRGRVLAAGLGAQTPVGKVASRQLKIIDGAMPSFAALRLMLAENIHHLPVVEEGKIIGVISGTDLLLQGGNNPLYLRATLQELEEPPSAAHYGEEIAALVASFFTGGLGTIQISQIVSSLNDALVERLIALAVAQLGPAPVPYAWIVFGSEGRLEQALLTDQDNALIYAQDSDSARDYFTTLAKRVVDGLIQAGFPPCAGGFMATNWCRPLAAWQELFAEWIRLPKPAALLEAAIFFDFRAVAGTLSLAPLEEIILSAKSSKLFLAHMARGAMDFRPPLGFFNLVRSEHGKIDLKAGAIAPIVGLARAAALAAGSLTHSTLERLAVAAKSAALLSQESAPMLAEIFPFFVQLRLRRQLAARAQGLRLDHKVDIADLSYLERRHLKEALILIKQIQNEVRGAWRLDDLN